MPRRRVRQSGIYCRNNADNKATDAKGQTEEILAKIDALLKTAGTNKSRLLSAVLYVSDMRVKPRVSA